MLARIGKLLIEYYWQKTPESDRRVCIHRTSCSKAVYEHLDNHALIKGIKIYLERRKTCNEFYQLMFQGNHVIIRTKYGKVISEDQINPLLVKDFRSGS